MSDVKITWEKYHDPFEELDDELKEMAREHDDDDEYTDGYEEGTPGMMRPRKAFPYVVLPTGPVNITQTNRPSEVWNLWVLHTNVDITHELKDVVKLISGVELLYVLSRYRLLIGLGKVFESSEVKVNIQDGLKEYVNNKMQEIIEEQTQNLLPNGASLIKMDEDANQSELHENVIIMQDMLKKQGDYWAIWVLPNRKMEVAHADDMEDEDFRKHLLTFLEGSRTAGGTVITSWDNA